MRVFPTLALALLATTALAADWPTFRADALQTGSNGEHLPAKLEVLWKFEAKDEVESTAAIVAGVVYVGSFDGNLYALDLQTGKEKWRFAVGPVKAAVSVRAGAVYVGNLDGEFHCVDAATGKKRWTFKTEGEIASGSNFAGDNVLFGSGDEHLYCVSPDGKLVWKYKVPGGPVNGAPAVAGERTFAAGCDSNLHVIDVRTGKPIGKVDIGGQVGAAAAVGGDHFFVGTISSNQVLAVNWKALKVDWKFESEKVPNSFYASPALTDQLVIAGSRDKRIWALNRRTGEEVWSFLTERHVNSSPVVAGQRVIGASLDGKLYVLDAAKGALVQKLDLGAPANASPALSAGRVVIGTEKGVIWCLGEKK